MYVSLVGRSNVGKSCLFNSILSHVGKGSTLLKSIVSENPGTTKDSKQSQIYIRGNRVTLVDTGGFEGFLWNSGLNTPFGTNSTNNGKYGGITDNLHFKNEKGFTHIENEAQKAVQNSSLVFFIVDGKEGVTPLDVRMGERLREWLEALQVKPEVKLVINKLENDGSEQYYENLGECLADCYSMEFGDPVVVSAHRNEGIEKLTSIIKSRLVPRDTSRLEEMAIIGNHLEDEHQVAQEHLEDIEDLHRHCEIEKTLRTCSSVRGTYRPNEKWMKLLNSVCGIPFIEREETEFIIPSLMSPSERLASLYISDKSKDVIKNENADLSVNVLKRDSSLDGSLEELSNVSNCVNSEEKSDANKEDKMGSNHGFGNNLRSRVKSRAKILGGNAVNPVNILVLGSVDSDRDSLLSLLCDNYEGSKISDLSPNWHSFYSNWQMKLGGKSVEQPVEIVISAALNLGGSLGRMAVVQTLSLLRRCDFVIFCINNSCELRKSSDGTKNVTMSKREIAWLSRAVRFKKPTTLAVHVKNNYKNCKLFLTKEYPLSFEFKNIPIVPIPKSNDTSHTSTRYRVNTNSFTGVNDTDSTRNHRLQSAEKLKRIIGSLLHRGKQMIDTSTLNAWLTAFVSKWPPPWKDGSKLNLKFAAQVRSSPPTFVLWSNVYASFPQHYLRQLKLALSEEFGFLGVPLKFVLKTTFKPSIRSKRFTRLKLRRKLHN